MTTREKDLIRYALAYLATGDGRKARSHTAKVLRKEDTREARKIADKMRSMVFAHARSLGR